MSAMPGILLLPHGLCGSTGGIKLLVPLALHHFGMGAHQKMCEMPAWAQKRTLEEPSGRAGARLPQHKSCCSQQLRVLSPEPSPAACVPPGMATLRRRETEPNVPHQSGHGHCCFFMPVKRDRGGKYGGKPYRGCKEQAGPQPEPPACPSVVTAAAPTTAVSLSRNIWRAGFGPAVLLAHHAGEKLPALEEDLHPAKHQRCTGSGWDRTIRWGYS